MKFKAECCEECIENGDCLFQKHGDVESCLDYQKSDEFDT